MWILFVVTFVVVCALIWDYLFKKRRNHILKASRIAGPSLTLPLVGDVFEMIGSDSLNVFAVYERLTNKFGSVFRLWFFHRLLLIVNDSKYFEVILSSHQLIKKPFMYDMFSCWLGDGLLLSNGAKWKARRKILTPTYHFKILEGFVKIFDQQSRVLIERLEHKADGKTAFDIFPIVCLTALDIIAETAMGVKIKAQENPDFPYAKAVKTATSILGNRNVNLLKYYDIGFLLSDFPSFLKLRKSIKIMHDFTNKVITDRRATIVSQNDKTEISDDLDVGQKNRMVFLDVLLQATIDGKPLSQEDIHEEVDTFMFGGHDTTTSGISHCLYLLSRHAHIQQKTYEEIIDILGPDKDKSTSMNNLHELKYLEAVIKESLRLYPAVPVIARENLQDLKIGEQVIPANTNIIMVFYGTSRYQDYFSEPNSFNPENFYGDESNNKNSFAYVPFSAGPRNCIGQKFAMLQMKTIISRILRHFEVLPLGEDVIPVFSIILRSSNGIQIGLRPRE